MSRSIFVFLMLAALSAWPAIAGAQTCTVQSAGGLNFGSNLTGSPTNQTDAFGTITLSCIGGGNGQTRRACLALGNDAPVPNPRRLVSGANTLNFQLYDNSTSGPIVATSQSESSGRIMEQTFVANPHTPVIVSFPIAGRLFAGQVAASGTYTLALPISVWAGNDNAGGCGPGDPLPQASSFVATASIGADCTLSIPDVSFGTVTRLTSPINTTTSATVTCSNGAPWTLALNAGSTPGNTYVSRRMSLGGSGPGTVQYQIYRDPGPANVWGNGTMGTVTRSGTGVGTPQSVPIYLQVPVQGPQAEGTYSDTVTATLTF
jgi:spore coat protein U-like protein